MAQIVWSKPALADLTAIARHIAADKPNAARKLVQTVIRQVDNLGAFPEAGGRPAELAGTPYRQLVVPPLRIFYRHQADTVLIVYVMRSERRLDLTDAQARED